VRRAFKLQVEPLFRVRVLPVVGRYSRCFGCAMRSSCGCSRCFGCAWYREIQSMQSASHGNHSTHTERSELNARSDQVQLTLSDRTRAPDRLGPGARTLRTRPFRKCSVRLVTEVWPVFERSKLNKLNTRSDQVQSAANSTRTTNKSRAPRVSGHHPTLTERSELSAHSNRTCAPGGLDPGARTCAPGQWGATCAWAG